MTPGSQRLMHAVRDDESRTILVVEDDYQAGKLISLYLIQAGYRPILARTGQEALETARRLHPGAITLDLLLPDMDGWEVLAQLKGAPETRDIPVVIVSVLDRQGFGFQLGAVEYLVKPVARSELLRALGRCLLMEGSAGERHRVLVVQGSVHALRSVISDLGAEGYEVIEAESSEEAIQLARSLSFDLLVINTVSSRRPGMEMVSALRAEALTRRIPSLILATEALVCAETISRPANEVHVVWAPGSDRTLLGIIQHLLQGPQSPGEEHE
jgi:CheY-like chemotaxis protein